MKQTPYSNYTTYITTAKTFAWRHLLNEIGANTERSYGSTNKMEASSTVETVQPVSTTANPLTDNVY